MLLCLGEGRTAVSELSQVGEVEQGKNDPGLSTIWSSQALLKIDE